MSDDEHKQAPTTVKEVGIHIGYIRDDIAELKQIVKEMKEESIGRVEFETYKKTIQERLTEIELKVNRRPWVLGTLIAIFSAIITTVVLYVVNDIINGGK